MDAILRSGASSELKLKPNDLSLVLIYVGPYYYCIMLVTDTLHQNGTDSLCCSIAEAHLPLNYQLSRKEVIQFLVIRINVVNYTARKVFIDNQIKIVN